MLGELKKEKLFYFFEEISSIPRGSMHNEKIHQYLVDFATSRHLKYHTDEALNIVICKEATVGYEACPSVVIQGHMDMVCECESSVEHDFETEGLSIYQDGEYIRARGTTLGADDGIALALGLAILDSNSCEHPALEMLFTTDEEIGMLGAKALSKDFIKSRLMINFDGGMGGTIVAGCAGGCQVEASFDYKRSMYEATQYKITVQGLQGGHSGEDIILKRYNAADELSRLLFRLQSKPYRIASFQGGDKDNVITTEATAMILSEEEDLISLLNRLKDEIVAERLAAEPAIHVLVEKMERIKLPCLFEADSKSMIEYITMAPKGIQTMSSEVDNTVETSINMGGTSVNADQCSFLFLARSQKETMLRFMQQKMIGLTQRYGGEAVVKSYFPPWDYKMDSVIQKVAVDTYQELFQKTFVI